MPDHAVSADSDADGHASCTDIIDCIGGGTVTRDWAVAVADCHADSNSHRNPSRIAHGTTADFAKTD